MAMTESGMANRPPSAAECRSSAVYGLPVAIRSSSTLLTSWRGSQCHCACWFVDQARGLRREAGGSPQRRPCLGPVLRDLPLPLAWLFAHMVWSSVHPEGSGWGCSQGNVRGFHPVELCCRRAFLLFWCRGCDVRRSARRREKGQDSVPGAVGIMGGSPGSSPGDSLGTKKDPASAGPFPPVAAWGLCGGTARGSPGSASPSRPFG